MVNYLAINCVTAGQSRSLADLTGSEFVHLPVFEIVKEGFLFSRVVDPVK
jgi:hypothetical protein